MIDGKAARPLLERLQALAAFLPLFEEPGFKFGSWAEPPSFKSDVILMPQYERGEVAQEFVQMAYTMDWVILGFDWPIWIGTEEAIHLRDDAQTLAAATPEQLARLLTAVIRRDRFVEGGLGSVYDSGLLTAITRRAAVLAEQLAPVEDERQASSQSVARENDNE